MAFSGKTVAAVVPAFKEETQIARVIDTMPDFVDWIVVIDDASPDRTSEVVKAKMSDNRRIILLIHEQNQGVGGAIATGYKWARDNNVDMAVVMAGDGQMDPADLPALLKPVAEEGVNYSKGNRLIYPKARELVPSVRWFGNSVLSLLTKIASGYWHVADSQTGYTVADKRVLQTIDWDRMYKRYGQPNDLLIKLNVENFRVRDVPIKPVYNIGEKSGIKVSRVLFTISGLLFKGFLWRLNEKYVVRDFHPLVLFYGLGAAFVIFSALFALRTIWLWVDDGTAPVLSSMAAMFFASMGLQSIVFAMWFDMEANRDLR
ncbi:MAG: glycosyltransferase family 2 protein [Parvularculaceae bacterium]|nr:glycosyltransferase family 2 protein [Parvularculaceae bacterium]